MLSTHNEEAYVTESVNSGALSYLIKQTSVDSVCNAILEVHQGNIFFGPSIPKRLHNRNQKTD
jgi:DNA-binding NarL/FixJ family response regulator